MSTASALNNRPDGLKGFSLLELLISMAMGLTICAVMVQLLQRDGRLSSSIARRMTERSAQRRTLELLRSEVQRAIAVRTEDLSSGWASRCGLGSLKLELETEQGPITYTVGQAPSAIWRGEVLMRCGPAYGLHGELSSGSALNRVVIDGLTRDGLQVKTLENGLLRLKLRQEVEDGNGFMQIESQLTVAARRLSG